MLQNIIYSENLLFEIVYAENLPVIAQAAACIIHCRAAAILADILLLKWLSSGRSLK